MEHILKLVGATATLLPYLGRSQPVSELLFPDCQSFNETECGDQSLHNGECSYDSFFDICYTDTSLLPNIDIIVLLDLSSKLKDASEITNQMATFFDDLRSNIEEFLPQSYSNNTIRYATFGYSTDTFLLENFTSMFL